MPVASSTCLYYMSCPTLIKDMASNYSVPHLQVFPLSKIKWMLKFMLTVIVHLPSCTLFLQDDWIGERVGGRHVAIATMRNNGPGINCWQHWTYHTNLMLVWMKEALSKILLSCSWKVPWAYVWVKVYPTEPELDMFLNIKHPPMWP